MNPCSRVRNLFHDFKRAWHQLRSDRPGERFWNRYRERQRVCRSSAGRTVSIVAGIFLCGTGLVLFVTPGPGVALLLIGCNFIARESPAASRLFDRAELRLRGAWGRIAATFARLRH